jgi:hypothetical protein
MDRKTIENLHHWHKQSDRKPLIIRGARQVGKTWLVKHFAKQLNLTLLELNFEREQKLRELFLDNDPVKILKKLSVFFSKDIDLKQSLLFLDEIQAAPELLGKLRWFAEEMPELPCIATGSLLDFILDEQVVSVPVGRIQYLHLEPMSFEEFLLAIGQNKLVEYLANYELTDKVPQILHDQLWEHFREYVFIGGLPAAVNNWQQNHSFLAVNEIHQNLLTTYRDDFTKYAKRIPHERLEEVFKAIPVSLGQKFKYSSVNKDVRSELIKNALNLLCKAKVCHKVCACSGSGIPLESSSKENIFKVFFLDVGLVSAACGLTLSNQMKFDELHLLNEGGIAEQVTGQLLRTTFPYFIEPKLHYWTREKSGSEAEIDYLIQDNMRIIPIEVKSGSTGTLRSLHTFMQLKNLNIAVRINADYPSITTVNIKNHASVTINYQLLSIPLYLTQQIHRLLGLLPAV